MGNNEFENKCIELVKKYYEEELKTHIEKEEIHIVLIVKALKNKKALISTSKKDTRYFEITFNGDKKETYIDCYIKEKNICVKE